MAEEAARPLTSPTKVLTESGRLPLLIPLDRVLERQRFSPMLTAILLLIFAFTAFQIVGSVVTLVALAASGLGAADLLTAVTNLATERPGLALGANTVGQFLGIGLPALLAARLHSSDWRGFLRLRRADAATVGVALLGLAALTPLVQWLASVNELLPLPEWLQALEDVQDEMIEQVLSQMTNVWLNLFMLAITPALCEELLFRGYAQRQAERGVGVMGGILFSGIVFGLYHLRLTQALPLATLGLYLAYLTWRTGSLWPAIAVHFANNGLAVVTSAYLQSRPELGTDVLEQIEVPWYYIVLGLLAFVPVVLWLTRRHAPVQAASPWLVSAPSNTPPGERQDLA